MTIDAEALKKFTDHVLSRFYTDVHHYEGADNFDAHRYPPEQARMLDGSRGVFNLSLFMQERERFCQAWSLLADDVSRALFIDLVRYQLSGHMHVRLPTNVPEFFAQKQGFKDYVATPSALPFAARHNGLQHYEFDHLGHKLLIDGYGDNIIWPLYHGQYFFNRNGVTIVPAAGDHIVDAGSCLGETAAIFGSIAGPQGYVYSFDLLSSHCAATRLNMRQNESLSRFHLFEAGLSNRVHQPAQALQNVQSVQPGFNIMQDGDFPTTTLDHLVGTAEIERVDFIKMDIEGSEMDALRGAEQAIRRFRPKLAISVYHMFQHMYEVPLFIAALDLGYKFYLQHYTIHREETVLYAIADA